MFPSHDPHQAIVKMKGQPVQRATFPRKTDAKKWAASTESAIREGRHFKTIEAKKHTLAELIERYIREVLPSKPKSQIQQARQLNWWKKEIGFYLLSDVTPALIAEQREKLLLDRQPATAVRYMAALSHAFTIAMQEWEWLEDNTTRS